MSEDGVGSGVVVAFEAIKPIGRTRLIKRDAVNNPVCNAGRVERVRYEVKKQIRTWRPWFKRVSEDLDYKMMPDAVRHYAWQMTHRHLRSDGKKQIERLRGRPRWGPGARIHRGHFRDTQSAAGTSKLYDEWSLRLWMEQVWVSDGHFRSTPRRDRRCRSSWKCPEDLRRVKRKLNEMIGNPWETSPRQEEEPRFNCRVCVTLERQIRYGGQKGCMVCCRHAGANPRDLRTRSQDTVNNEAAQTDRASSTISPGQTSISLSSGTVQSSRRRLATWRGYSCGKFDDTADDEINDSGDGDQSRDKRQRVLASRPDRTGVDVNACTCTKIVTDGLSRLWIGTRNALKPRVDILDICKRTTEGE